MNSKNYLALLNPDFTCILTYQDQIIYASKENSVKPFVKYIHYNGIPSNDVILIDRIIGLAIAHVAIYSKIKWVYTKVISEPAHDLLCQYGVDVYYERKVTHILRRDRSDICPMEKLIMNANSPTHAYKMLEEIVINNNNIHLD